MFLRRGIGALCVRSLTKTVEGGKPHGIYVNNQVELKSCEIFGFDYDYTLAEYKVTTQKFIFDCAKNILADKYGFPERVKTLEFDPEFIIRGLFYDPKRCVMMKLDSYSVIDAKAVYRGLERVSESELENIYETRRMGIHRVDKHFSTSGNYFYQVLDEFSIPEAYLFSSIRQMFTDDGLRFDPILTYRGIRQAIGDVHIQQHLYQEIIQNLDKYLEKGSMTSVVSHLSNSKTLFIISNSPFWFIDAGMRHLVSDDWRDAFDVVITEARKPSFFLEQKPFLELRDAGRRTKTGEIKFEKRENWNKATKLEKGKIYYEGSLSEFGQLTGWNQKSVLYFGDQVNADLAEPSLRFGWRTAAIVPELAKEIETYNSSEFIELVHRLNVIESEYDQFADHGKDYAHICAALLEDRQQIKRSLKAAFKSPFGSIFRCDLTKSHYARQCERYAELYTSSISNLSNTCLERTFYPPRVTLGCDHKLMQNMYSDSTVA